MKTNYGAKIKRILTAEQWFLDRLDLNLKT